MSIRALVVALFAATVWCRAAASEPCAEGWSPGFGWQWIEGSGAAIAPVMHEGREMLLLVGDITDQEGVENGESLLRTVLWDGVKLLNPFAPAYSGARPLEVWAMVPAPASLGGGVLAAGRFYADANATAAYFSIARFSNDAWTVITTTSGIVHDLAIFDEGAGPRLFVGGEFQQINSEAIPYLARWDGLHWTPVGLGVNHRVRALETHDDGQGAALFVGGDFSEAGLSPAIRIARWSGSSWSALGAGTAGSVQGLGSVTVDGAPALVASGLFLAAGGQPVARIAMWREGAWSPMGAGFASGSATAFTMFDRGDGAPVLYAAGDFTAGGGVSGLASFEGGQWLPALGGQYKGLIAWDAPGTPPERLVVSRRTSAGTGVLFQLFDGTQRIALAHGAAPHSFAGGQRLLVYGEGDDQRLLLFGQFSQMGEIHLGSLGAWNGETWESVPWWHGGRAYDTAEFEYNGAPALAVVGRYMTIDGVRRGAIVIYQDGVPFVPDGGLPGDDSGSGCVVVLPEVDGASVVVGGVFDQSAGAPARKVAAWNGFEWRSLDANLSEDARVGALAVYDDGNGPTLYAGGYRLLGYSSVVRWTGTEWAELQEYTAVSSTYDLLVADVGEGERLYIGGSFGQSFPGVQGRWSIISWDGSTLRPFGTPLAPAPRPPFYSWYPGEVQTLDAFEVNGRKEMFVGGRFQQSGPRPLRYVARWADGQWRQLSRGVLAWTSESNPVRSFAVWDDGNGLAAFVTGTFGKSGAVMSDFARFRLCTPDPATNVADLNADGIVDLRDVARLTRAIGDRGGEADAQFDINGDGAVNTKDVEAALGAMGQAP